MARIKEIVFDAALPSALARFWAEVLSDYPVRAYDPAEIERLTKLGCTPETDPAMAVDGPGPTLFMQKMSVQRGVRNRVHLDIVGGKRSAEVERLLGLGATAREERDDLAILLDPEGHAFRVHDPADAGGD